MAVYTRETRVEAPLDPVWEFHGRIEGLVELTPGVLRLRVEGVRGPDGEFLRGPAGESGRGELTEGTAIRLSVRPFGVGPRQGWTSRIVARRRADGRALLRDEMVEGPFREWVHAHEFVADGAGTVARDRVAYRIAGGAVEPVVSALAWPGLALAFHYRHRRLRELFGGRAAVPG